MKSIPLFPIFINGSFRVIYASWSTFLVSLRQMRKKWWPSYKGRDCVRERSKLNFHLRPHDLEIKLALTKHLWIKKSNLGSKLLENMGMLISFSMNSLGNSRTEKFREGVRQVCLSHIQAWTNRSKSKKCGFQPLIIVLVCSYTYIYIWHHRQTILSPQWKENQYKMNT